MADSFCPAEVHGAAHWPATPSGSYHQGVCPELFDTEGPMIRWCLPGTTEEDILAHWGPVTGHCIRRLCYPSHGWHSTWANTTAVQTCVSNGGLTMKGTMERFCMPNGTWASPGDCDFLGSIDTTQLAAGLLAVLIVGVVVCGLLMLCLGCTYARKLRLKNLEQEPWTEMGTVSTRQSGNKRTQKAAYVQVSGAEVDEGAETHVLGVSSSSESVAETVGGLAGAAMVDVATIEMMTHG